MPLLYDLVDTSKGIEVYQELYITSGDSDLDKERELSYFMKVGVKGKVGSYIKVHTRVWEALVGKLKLVDGLVGVNLFLLNKELEFDVEEREYLYKDLRLSVREFEEELKVTVANPRKELSRSENRIVSTDI